MGRFVVLISSLKKQSGSAVTAMMGGVAILGMLSFGSYQLMSGPLSSMSNVTQNNLVQDQMLGISAISAIDAANLGDCDDDGYVEPRQFRATTGGAPVNGGLVPTDMGVDIKDPWNMDYGYCVWDMGPLSGDAGCGGAGANRLDGANNAVGGDPETLTVFALVSAGRNRTFETTCDDYTDTTTDVITTSGDDIVARFTYNEASTATSSLWALKSGDADTAQIDKNLEVGDDLNFDKSTGALSALALNASDAVIADGGAKLGDQTQVADSVCDTFNFGLLRYNSVSKSLEFCDTDSDWTALGGSGGGLSWPLLAPDGSAAVPSYSFSSGTASGLYQENGNLELVSPGENIYLRSNSSYMVLASYGIYTYIRGPINIFTPNDDKVTFTNNNTDFYLNVLGGVKVGDTTATCGLGTKGTIKYLTATKSFEYCNGTTWEPFTSNAGCNPVFDVTDADNVNMDIFILSEEITIGGLYQPCYLNVNFGTEGSIVLNGVNTGKNFVQISNGDTVQLRQKTPATTSTVATTTIYSGEGDLLDTWTITTTACPGGSGTQTYNTAGTYTFALPANTENCDYSITVKGGGGGTFSTGFYCENFYGQGGGMAFDWNAGGDVASFNILIGGGGSRPAGGYGGGGQGGASSRPGGGGASALKYNSTLVAVAGGGAGVYAGASLGRGAPYGAGFTLKGQDGDGEGGGPNGEGGAGQASSSGKGGDGGTSTLASAQDGQNGVSASLGAGGTAFTSFSVSGGGGGGSYTAEGAGGGGGYGGGGGGARGVSQAGGGGGYLKITGSYSALPGYQAVDGGDCGIPGEDGEVIIEWGF